MDSMAISTLRFTSMARVPLGSWRRASISFLKNVMVGETTFRSGGMVSITWLNASVDVAATM